MKHYKNKDGTVCAFEDDGSQDHIIMKSMVSLSDAELDEIINPPTPIKDVKSNALAFVNATYLGMLSEIDIIGADYLRRQMADQSAGKPTPGKDKIPMSDTQVNALLVASDNLIADAMKYKEDSIIAIGAAKDEQGIETIISPLIQN